MSLIAIAAVSLGSSPSGEDALELVRTAFASSCVECHSGERPKAGLELTGNPLEIPGADPELWLELIERVELGEMPPAGGGVSAGLEEPEREAAEGHGSVRRGGVPSPCAGGTLLQVLWGSQSKAEPNRVLGGVGEQGSR